jgi:hypothetical protein
MELSKKKLPTKNSTAILRSFESLIKVGNSLPSAIEVLIQVETGKTRRVLEKVNYYITKQDYSIGQALEQEGIIQNTEVVVIDKSTNALEAVKSIIAIRELTGNFEETVFKLFFFPVLAVIIGLSVAYAFQPTFHDMVFNLVDQVRIAKGIDMSDDTDLMWYLLDRNLNLYIMGIYLLIISSIIFIYFYKLKYKPENIYKTLPLKAYDDVPYILMLIYNLQKVGLDQVRVFRLLKESSPRQGWIKLFDLLEKEALEGRFIYTVFDKYHFPKDVVLVLKSAEVSKTFWDNTEVLVTYVKDTNLNKHKNIQSTFGGLSTVVGFLIILYFVSGLFMAMFSLQNIAMSLM